MNNTGFLNCRSISHYYVHRRHILIKECLACSPYAKCLKHARVRDTQVAEKDHAGRSIRADTISFFKKKNGTICMACELHVPLHILNRHFSTSSSVSILDLNTRHGEIYTPFKACLRITLNTLICRTISVIASLVWFFIWPLHYSTFGRRRGYIYIYCVTADVCLETNASSFQLVGREF